MYNEIKNFLLNKTHTGYADLSKVTVFECNQKTVFSEYISIFNSSKRFIVLFFYDHFYVPDVSKGTENLVSNTLIDIINVCKQYKNKQVILFTENINTEEILNLYKPFNLKIITSPIGMYEYKDCLNDTEISIEKTFLDRYHVLCLNNNPRAHRIGTLLYIKYLHLEPHIFSTLCINKTSAYNRTGILSYINPRSTIRDKLCDISLSDIKANNFKANTTNFKDNLVPLFKNSVVSIITETTSLEKFSTLTEKFPYCILGRNFPIIVGTLGNVELYRKMGFDMFDDIIDHSYDYEPNPFYRMKMAIDSNIKILTDKEFAVALYDKSKKRLDNNVKHYKKQYIKVLNDSIGNIDATLRGLME